jgi:hypothetical protein
MAEISRAARTEAGPVFLAAGSTRTGAVPRPRSSLRTAAESEDPVTTRMASGGATLRARRTVSRSRESRVPSARRGFGRTLRESGQNLSPLPPARITTLNMRIQSKKW